MVGSDPSDLGSNPRGATLFVHDFSVAPHRVNSHITTICSVHARPANEMLSNGHS